MYMHKKKANLVCRAPALARQIVLARLFLYLFSLSKELLLQLLAPARLAIISLFEITIANTY